MSRAALGVLVVGLMLCAACSPVDPCAARDCGRGVCVVTSGAPACLCEGGFQELDGRCFPITACGALRPAADGGCSQEPRWDCSQQTVSSAADPAEPNDCPPQARALAIDGAAIGAFGSADDVDWYFVAPAPNTVVRLRSEGSRMTVVSYDADGFSERALLPLPTTFSVGSRGLLLVVRAIDQGPYRLELERVGEDDRTDELVDAPDVPADATIRGTLDFPRDVDVVALRLAPESSVDVRLTAEGARVDVLDANGRILLWNTSDLRVWGDGSPLFLAVRAGASAMVPVPWTLELSSRGADDAPDHPAFARVSRTGGDQVFEFPGDIDVFRIEPVLGHVYEATCLDSSSCFVALLNEAGPLNGASLLRFHAPAAGASFLSFSLLGSSIGEWKWRLVDLGADDHGDFLQTATALGTATAIRGTLEFSGDVDAFTFSYPLGTVLRFTLPPDKRVQGATDVLVITEAPMLVTLEGSPGPYDIAVSVIGTDLGGEGAPVAIALPFSLDGGFDYPGDLDAFTFNVIAGHVYEATITPSSAWVSLRESTFFRQYSGQGSARLVPSETGRVDLSVFNGPEGGYQLSVSDVGVDDQPDTAATPLAPLNPGVPTQGVFDWGGDIDLFLGAVVPGRFYEGRCSTPDCLVRLGTSQGRQASVCLQATAPQLTVGLEPSYRQGGFVPRPWAVELVDLGADDHSGSQSLATMVPFESTTAAMLTCHADLDAFTWTAGPRQLTSLRASCDGCTVEVARSGGSRRGEATDGGIALTIGSSSTPIVALFWTSSPTPLSFSVTDGGFDDHGDNLVSATVITPGTRVSGRLQFDGDIDALAFDLPAGGHPVELIGANVSADVWLATGPVISLGQTSLQFTAATAGRYFVLLRGAGDYELVIQ